MDNNISQLAKILSLYSPAERAEFLSHLSLEELSHLKSDWSVWARPNQRWEALWPSDDKPFSLVLAGRGWGKTRCAVEAVRTAVYEYGYKYISIIGATATDTRQICICGESGILNSFPEHQRPEYHPGNGELVFPNGAMGFAYSADSPERLRGKQCDFFWADEICAWEQMRSSYDQIMFGCRLGNPRGIVTTTPKPSELLNEILNDPLYSVITGSTYDNAANLAPSFLQQIVKRYLGTRTGEQELYGVVLKDIMGALWNAEMFKYTDLGIEELKAKCVNIVISVDPAVSANANSDATGIIAAGVDCEENFYVLEDATGIFTPNQWREEVMRLYDKFSANMVVAEVNNGGDLVQANLPQRLPYKAVHASRGKAVRAEPVVGYYEQGKVFHRRGLVELETEMCTWIPAKSTKSPNRVDGLSWAWTYLLGVGSRSSGCIASRLWD